MKINMIAKNNQRYISKKEKNQANGKELKGEPFKNLLNFLLFSKNC